MAHEKKKKKINLAQQLVDVFRQPSAFANIEAAKQLAEEAKKRRKNR